MIDDELEISETSEEVEEGEVLSEEGEEAEVGEVAEAAVGEITEIELLLYISDQIADLDLESLQPIPPDYLDTNINDMTYTSVLLSLALIFAAFAFVIRR